MAAVIGYVVGSVLLISILAMIGVITVALNEEVLQRFVHFLVSFAAGALFGNAFIHLLPHAAEGAGFTNLLGVYVIGGIVISFMIETYIHWHHQHHYGADCEDCVEPHTYMILIGDAVHNLIDGIVVAAAYIASIPAGIATTVAVMFHEIPQELGDFGVLVHGGFTTRRALLYNFVSALPAFIGAGLTLYLSTSIDGLHRLLLPFAAGGFIYIAGSDLIPEIRGDEDPHRASAHVATFVAGVVVMYLLTFLSV